MKNTFWIKLFVFVFFSSIFSSPSQAFYKKKVLVGKFQNPANWTKPYHPGDIISELLSQELKGQERVQLISISEHMMRLMENATASTSESYVEPAFFDSEKMNFPEILSIQDTGLPMKMPAQKMDPMDDKKDENPLWPTELGTKPTRSTFTEIRGTVIKFQPDMKSDQKAGAVSLKSSEREKAEVQVHIELVQSNTGRILYEKNFAAFANLGTQPFSIETLKNRKPGSSSMGLALGSLKQKIGLFILEKLDTLLLEGEIIATKGKKITQIKGEKPVINEEILVSLGSSNGVRIGDLLQVHALGLGLKDPYTANDLGDVYVKVGVVQVLQTWEGTAKARSLAGNNFETGYLVRSMTPLRKGKFSSTDGSSVEQDAEKVPWWDFHGIRSVH